MPDLLFEMWKDGRSIQMGMVHPQNDRARFFASPNAVLVHSFTAHSDFEAFRYNNAWQGYEPWLSPEDLDEHFFTDEEVAVQQAYLRERTTNQP